MERKNTDGPQTVGNWRNTRDRGEKCSGKLENVCGDIVALGRRALLYDYANCARVAEMAALSSPT